MIHDNTIRVGAYDWDHAHWLGSFFPDDLPEDWRLSYYANEFTSVLVPEFKWRIENAELEQWVEDTPPAFRFYFHNASGRPCDKPISVMGDKFAGFVLPDKNADVALLNYQSKSLREWKDGLLNTELRAIFLTDERLTVTQLSDFKSLIEFIGL